MGFFSFSQVYQTQRTIDTMDRMDISVSLVGFWFPQVENSGHMWWVGFLLVDAAHKGPGETFTKSKLDSN